jgi:LmbE family N-acetylglucosaminyl deacetylase
MVITAHPDDEVFNFGGTLRLYADQGVETAVICLTPGQAATHRGGAKNDHELAEMRRKEFAAACKMLKVGRAVILDYPDSKLHRQDSYHVISDLTLHVRQFRPGVLLTFGPEGGLTGHTDHSMASMFATLAFHWAGRENRFPDQLANGLAVHQAQKLYYSTADFTLEGHAPVSVAPATTTIEIGSLLEAKLAAFQAHSTQMPIFPLLEKNARKQGARELFHLAAASGVAPEPRESDLFAGIRGTP